MNPAYDFHLGRGEEIATTVLRLCSRGASFVLGVALPVDGVYTAHGAGRTNS